MSRTQKNKATAAHLGSLKAKLAKLRRDLIEGSGAKSGPKGEGFDVTKTGDCRVGMVGFPSVGKSTLLNKLDGHLLRGGGVRVHDADVHPGVIGTAARRFSCWISPASSRARRTARDAAGRSSPPREPATSSVIVLDAPSR